MAGWRPALRLARRDALRSRGRSILVLVMIALPVLAVSAADVVYSTTSVSGVESLGRRLGAADARIAVQPGLQRAIQDFDPDTSGFAGGTGGKDVPLVSLDTVRATLGRDVPAVERREGSVRVDTDRGAATVEAVEVDATSPLTVGLFRLTDGRYPTAPDEVAVNAALADKGFAVGATMTLDDGADLRVVGVAESTSSRGFPMAVAPLGTLGVPVTEGLTTWLVGGGPVSWAEVRDLNRIGAVALSRAVLLDPPADSALPVQVREAREMNTNSDAIAVVALVVVMALLEVVLLAGPAFAVGARRQTRTLALMAASGGTPAQARRVILAGGVVLGGAAAGGGVVLGIGVGWALLPVVQHYSDSWLGPFDLNLLQLLAIAGFGLLSAFLAAVVPAWIASRQDVVAVLAGRRADRPVGYRSPLLGLLLLGVGVALAAYGAIGLTGDGSVLIAGSAVISVLGMILLVPVVLIGLAALSSRLPLVTRYAVRDAARHRTRTVPAVAAVAATVAGVVALGIGNASDGAERQATYSPQLPAGLASLTDSSGDADWAGLEGAVHRLAPTAAVTSVQAYDGARGDSYLDLRVRRPGGQGFDPLLSSYGSSFGSVLVGEDLLEIAPVAPGADLTAARQVLEQGGAVVFTSEPVEADRIRFSGRLTSMSGGEEQRLTPVELPAVFVPVVSGTAPALALVAPGALDGLGVEAETTGLLLDAHQMSVREEDDLREVVGGLSDGAFLYVERGFQEDNQTLIVLSILFGLGAVLMLGGTLTATFLALSDARPDLATLSAVGASPRTRRGVAAAYALVVGFVGALLGAAVGFIPGIAVTYPLTSTRYLSSAVDASGAPLPSHFVDVPWTLVIGLVVVLPLVTAVVVGLTARARLPLVSRLV